MEFISLFGSNKEPEKPGPEPETDTVAEPEAKSGSGSGFSGSLLLPNRLMNSMIETSV